MLNIFVMPKRGSNTTAALTAFRTCSTSLVRLCRSFTTKTRMMLRRKIKFSYIGDWRVHVKWQERRRREAKVIKKLFTPNFLFNHTTYTDHDKSRTFDNPVVGRQIVSKPASICLSIRCDYSPNSLKMLLCKKLFSLNLSEEDEYPNQNEPHRYHSGNAPSCDKKIRRVIEATTYWNDKVQDLPIEM